ncbi:MAG: L-2-amino-thiazoline-4-carboxylic acid hydrolase [Ginsengibacter sp.]
MKKQMAGYKKYFIKTIKENFPKESDKIIANTNNHFKNISIDVNFAATSKNPLDKRLDFSAYFLALIKTLDEKGETFETINKVCLEVVTEFVRPKNKIQKIFKRLPPKFANTWLANIVVKLLNKKVSQNTNPDGFLANIITDKQETFGFGYGFDILECGICKLFKKHNYQKYSSILCEVDKITSGLAGLELIRTGTIAGGAMKCDFRFKKKTEINPSV